VLPHHRPGPAPVGRWNPCRENKLSQACDREESGRVDQNARRLGPFSFQFSPAQCPLWRFSRCRKRLPLNMFRLQQETKRSNWSLFVQDAQPSRGLPVDEGERTVVGGEVAHTGVSILI